VGRLTTASERLYGRLPAPLQHVAISAFGYTWRRRRFGGRFQEYRDGFASRAAWDAAKWEAFQENRLRELATRAWDAPHYREAWARAGLGRSDVGSLTLSDLPALPVVTKGAVRLTPDAFCVGGAPPRGASVSLTSGSTGTPLTLYDTADDLRRALALRDARYEEFTGATYALPRATFSGRRVEPASDSHGPFHRFNLAERQVYFSPYHLGPKTAAQYVDAIVKHRPEWITGYSTCLADLAHLALEQELRSPPMRAVITTGEPVPESLRREGPLVYGARVTEEYGLAEQVCFAIECEEGSLHLSPDAGIVEILDEADELCARGEVGEIVATGFVRESQLLVRYRTGDLGSLALGPCACGRHTPILASLEGRVDDYVVGADGRRVGRLSHVPKGLPGVLAMQFVQQRPGQISAHVVSENELDPAVAATIRDRLVERLGEGMTIEVRQVADLVRTPRGKIRGIIRLPYEPA
jgi:phenylacetate-coenzyme A ligase PaaK-like adenylate-forming protein